MQLTIHLSKYYDWEPLPDGVEPTEADIRALRVKPTANPVAGKSSWLMKVTKIGPTHTSVGLPENQVIAFCVGGWTQDKRVLTRAQAICEYVRRHVAPHHFHRKWVTDVELVDSGADKALFEKTVGAHVDAGNIPTGTGEDDNVAAEMLVAYLEDRGEPGLRDDLLAAFGVVGGAA